MLHTIKSKYIYIFSPLVFMISACGNSMENRLAACEAYGVSRDVCYKAERDDQRSYQEQAYIRYERAVKAADELRARRKKD